jgi:hypothetical protein
VVYWRVVIVVCVHQGAVVVSRHIIVSFRWLLHCLPLAWGRRRSLREDEPLRSRSRVYFRRSCTLFVMLWMGLVCVPEGGVEWDMQVCIAEEVGIIRNVMDDRRRVGR